MSIPTVGAGKGDKWRITNFKKFFENFEEIFLKKDPNAIEIKKLKGGKTRYIYK